VTRGDGQCSHYTKVGIHQSTADSYEATRNMPYTAWVHTQNKPAEKRPAIYGDIHDKQTDP
jgi:hypothetical protein